MAAIRSFRDLIAYITAEEHGRFDALFQEVGAVLQGMIDRAEIFCHPVKR